MSKLLSVTLLVALSMAPGAQAQGTRDEGLPTYYFLLGRYLEGEGNGELSIDLMLARLYLDADRPADAIPLLRRIVNEQPQYVDGAVLLAEAQEAAGSADAAIETLTNVLADQPQFFRGRVQLAEL